MYASRLEKLELKSERCVYRLLDTGLLMKHVRVLSEKSVVSIRAHWLLTTRLESNAKDSRIDWSDASRFE
jgi:hypothetical protein